jgi:nitrate/nitrite-specific signal transduction histidine kinase
MTQNLGLADPCTFRIVVKNVTVLMDDDDTLKIETKAVLAQLVSSYELLDDLILSADEFGADAVIINQVEPALTRTIELEQKLKEQITLCVMQEA